MLIPSVKPLRSTFAAVNPTRLGSCWTDPPASGSADGETFEIWNSPELPLTSETVARARPAGLSHAADGSATRAT